MAELLQEDLLLAQPEVGQLPGGRLYYFGHCCVDELTGSERLFVGCCAPWSFNTLKWKNFILVVSQAA